MLKRQELLLPQSCLNKAGDEEPVFVLRAKDPLAPQTIRHWASMSTSIHEQDKIAEARKLAHEMEDWYAENCPTPARAG